MTRPFTRKQALENAAFLRALRVTGNVREAARSIGVHRATYLKRRARDEAFAAEWDAALAIASATLSTRASAPAETARAAVTEPRTVRTKSGRVQLRRVQPGRLTRDAEQAFLTALGATANVRLAAAAAGFSHSAFYHRRKTCPAFAREMRLALEQGYERVEMALLAASVPGAYRHDAWRHNDPPAIPPMTANQALQLLYLHQKEARLGGTPPDLRRRKGESAEAQSMRLGLMYEHQMQRAREDFLVAEAARMARDPGYVSYVLERPVVLPDLAALHANSDAIRETANARPGPAEPGSDPRLREDRLTGFARGGSVYDATRALFGGWRLGDIEQAH